MILYNMRYKGPLEYDKFLLNTLQFNNEINSVLNTEFDTDKNNNLVKTKEMVDKFYKYYVGDNQNIGISEQLYYSLLYYKEC